MNCSIVSSQVVGVADPRKFARTKLQQQHKIIEENVFEGEHQGNQTFNVFVIIYLCDNRRLNPLFVLVRLAQYN